MKRFILSILIGLFVVAGIFAQAPQAFKYQTVVRNNTGDLISNQAVSFRIGIVLDSINGILVYSEIHNETTNQFGLVNLEVGTGTVESGVFADINWGSASNFLKVELDETGNTNYQLIGTSQLLSVPYSLNSLNASSLTLTDENGNNYEISIDTLGNLETNLIVGPWECGNQINDIDGNTYNTVLIGTQCWMKENLKTTTYANGTPIPNVTDNTAWQNLTTGAYAWYENEIGWKDSYGALYNWYTTVDANGLCPTGWHVPAQSEWTDLTNHIGGIDSPYGNEFVSLQPNLDRLV